MFVAMIVEPLLDIDRTVAHVPTDTDPGGSLPLTTPSVDGRERNAEIVREIGRAKKTGSPYAGIHRRAGGRRIPVMGVGS